MNLRIKQIKLPSGNTYNLYDSYTREMISAKEYTPGISYNTGDLIVYEDTLYKVNSDIAATVNTDWSKVSKTATTIDQELASMRNSVTGVMKYRGVTITTLTDGSTVSTLLIEGNSVEFGSGDAGSVVISGTGASQKEFVWSGTTWNEFGSTGALKALAFKDFASGTYDKATGGSVTIPTVSGKTSHLKATASGAAVSITNTASAITGFGDHSKAAFVTAYPGTTSKLVTTTVKSAGTSVSIPNVTSVSSVSATNTVLGVATTASKAIPETAISVAKKGTDATVASGNLGLATSVQGDNTPMWNAVVTDETLSFEFKPLSTTSVSQVASDTETIIPYTFTDVSVPVITSNDTVTSSNVTLGTEISAAGAGTDVTVATGALDATGKGASLLTGLGTAETAQAITNLGAATTSDVATAVSLTAQPTITLSISTESDSTTQDVITTVNTGTTSAEVTITNTPTAITVS